MFLPFGRKRTIKERIKERLKAVRNEIIIRIRNPDKLVIVAKYWFLYARMRSRKLIRGARYAAEDTVHHMRRLSRHTEVLLFSAIVVLGAIMLVSAGNADFLNSLIALLLLVLVAVIYVQLRFQKRMLDQYVPSMDFVKLGMVQAYSERIRMVNLYGALDRMDRIKKVRNVHMRYEVMNSSFSPVSLHSASLDIKLKKGKPISLPAVISILNVEPKRSSRSEVSFRLPRELDFGSIEWMELVLVGNCEKKIRVKPHLYVNLVIRGKKTEFIFEPFAKFRKRKQVSGGR